MCAPKLLKTVDSWYKELHDIHHTSELDLEAVHSEFEYQSDSEPNDHSVEIFMQSTLYTYIEDWRNESAYVADEPEPEPQAPETLGFEPTQPSDADLEPDLLDLNRCGCLLEDGNSQDPGPITCLACEMYAKHLACVAFWDDGDGGEGELTLEEFH